MRAPYLVAAVIMCAALAHVPEALSQSSDPTLWVITSRGNLFELQPLTDVPTTDIVSSPYVEFQRTGGLVASAGMVHEAAQYNTVGTGNTYIVSNWGEGKTYGIPNAAPLGGELRLSPVPHLHLRDQKPIGGTYFSDAIIGVEPIVGSGVTYTNHTDTQYGEYYEFGGTGRAIVWLEPVDTIHDLDRYVINMVCPACVDTTRAVVGMVLDNGGSPKSNKWGTTNSTTHYGGIPCTIDGVNHMACGATYMLFEGGEESMWPVDPRPDLDGGSDDRTQLTIKRGLHFHTLDTATCPDATHANTKMEMLNDTYFRAVSDGCVMTNFVYRWHDAAVEMLDPMPLRAGINTYEGAAGEHPAIVINMDGGKVMLQAKLVHETQVGNAYEDTLTINTTPPPGQPPLVDSNSVIILHDAYAHLGYYTESTLRHMADRIQTYPQKQPTGTFEFVSHNHGGSAVGGLLGDPCSEPHQYCITVFDKGSLPVVNNAAGVLYDPRNNAELNRGSAVGNRGNVFVGTVNPTILNTVGYDPNKLNIIQSYAVIPVSGHVDVEEMYVMAGRGGGTGCDRYVDDTTDPHTWAAPAAPGWLRLKYLETDYGSGNNLIQVPLLPWYDTVCMRTHGNDEFRQFRVDNFFTQGAALSYGGVRHITAYTSSGGVDIKFTANPFISVPVLHTDAVLPGSGVRVMDMDIDLAARVMSASSVEGGGGDVGSSRDHECDWDATERPSRADNSAQHVHVTIYVDIQVPAVGGSYHSIGGLSVAGTESLEPHMLPSTVGADCMEIADIEFDFDPEYRTMPIEYQSNTPVRIAITADVDFDFSSRPDYADSLADETIFVEVHIQRLSLRVN